MTEKKITWTDLLENSDTNGNGNRDREDNKEEMMIEKPNEMMDPQTKEKYAYALHVRENIEKFFKYNGKNLVRDHVKGKFQRNFIEI